MRGGECEGERAGGLPPSTSRQPNGRPAVPKAGRPAGRLTGSIRRRSRLGRAGLGWAGRGGAGPGRWRVFLVLRPAKRRRRRCRRRRRRRRRRRAARAPRAGRAAGGFGTRALSTVPPPVLRESEIEGRDSRRLQLRGPQPARTSCRGGGGPPPLLRRFLSGDRGGFVGRSRSGDRPIEMAAARPLFVGRSRWPATIHGRPRADSGSGSQRPTTSPPFGGKINTRQVPGTGRVLGRPARTGCRSGVRGGGSGNKHYEAQHGRVSAKELRRPSTRQRHSSVRLPAAQ